MFLFQKRDDFAKKKKIKKLENECLIRFLQKYFEMLNKKNDYVWNKKKVLEKKRGIENDEKKCEKKGNFGKKRKKQKKKLNKG